MELGSRIAPGLFWFFPVCFTEVRGGYASKSALLSLWRPWERELGGCFDVNYALVATMGKRGKKSGPHLEGLKSPKKAEYVNEIAAWAGANSPDVSSRNARSGGLRSICVNSHDPLGNLALLRVSVLCYCYQPTNTSRNLPTALLHHHSSPASFSSLYHMERRASGSPQQLGRCWQSSGGERSDLGVHSRFFPNSCKLEESQQRKGEHLQDKARKRRLRSRQTPVWEHKSLWGIRGK